jgi:hypothetical protein
MRPHKLQIKTTTDAHFFITRLPIAFAKRGHDSVFVAVAFGIEIGTLTPEQE